MGGRAAESSAPHGEEAGRDRTGRGGAVEEFGQMRRGKVVDGLERKQEDFEVYAEIDQEWPVELLQNRGDLVDGGGSGDDSSCRVLNQLKFMEVFVRSNRRELQ